MQGATRNATEYAPQLTRLAPHKAQGNTVHQRTFCVLVLLWPAIGEIYRDILEETGGY